MKQPEISMMARLKAFTCAQHESLERQVDLLSRTRDISSYQDLLEGFFGFFHPFEKAMYDVPGLADALPDWHSRMRSGLLKADLAALGASDAPPCCSQLPEIRTVAQALGCLYVAEGSTLGGQIIVRQLKGLTGACWYFSSYGSDVGPMWRRFGAAVEDWAADRPGDAESICGSARETFRCLEAWLVERPCLTAHR